MKSIRSRIDHMFDLLIKRYKEYNRIANISEIGRRYFVMNSFDGILTVIGIVVGSFLAGITEARTVIVTGLATCMAMAVSGIWGTYLTESAERKKKLKDLSRHTLHDLKNTKIAQAQNFASIFVSAIDGLAPLISGLVVLIPFFLSEVLSIKIAYRLSIAISLSLLAVLGAFLGSISKENVLINGVKMLFAGVLSIGLIFMLEHLA